MSDRESLTEMLRARADLADRIEAFRARRAEAVGREKARVDEVYEREVAPLVREASGRLRALDAERKPLEEEAAALDARIAPALGERIAVFTRDGRDGPFTACVDDDGEVSVAPASWSFGLAVPETPPGARPAAPSRGPDGLLRIVARGIRDALEGAAAAECACPDCEAARARRRAADAEAETSVATIDAEVS